MKQDHEHTQILHQAYIFVLCNYAISLLSYDLQTNPGMDSILDVDWTQVRNAQMPK